MRETVVQEQSHQFRVHLLGPFAVYHGDQLIDTGTWQRSAQTLLKLLATGYQERRLRDEVVDILWPDAAPEAGASNLRYILSVLRKALGSDPPAVLAERGWLSLNPALGWEIDLVTFERIVSSGTADRDALERAMSLYRGEALVEDRYEDWAQPIRDRLQRAWRETCLRLAQLAAGSGEHEVAAQWLDRVLTADPLDEEAMQNLLRVLTVSGRRADALRRFTHFKAHLRSQLDVDPSDETEELVASIRRGEGPSTASIADCSHPPPDSSGNAPPPEERASPAELLVGGYLGSLPSGPLVGRRHELSQVVDQVDAVSAGQGSLLVVSGEPGVGKTRFAQEVTRIALDRHFVVVTGRCYESEQATPYYPFLDVLRTLYASVPTALRAAVPARWPHLARLLPALAPAVSVEREPWNEQQQLFLSVTDFLETASNIAPVALMLDDLHWSDAASLRLLLHICRHTRRCPVLLVGTYRDVEVGRHHPLERALVDLTREGLLTRLVLRRLDRQDTGSLIALTLGEGDVSLDLVDTVHRPTEGNPFFVQQVVRSMVERGDLYRENGRWLRRGTEDVGVPESVRAAIGQRLSCLAADTQELLREASVLGQTFLFDDLQSVSRREEDEVERGLQEALEHGLIQAVARDAYGFDHALTRQTVLAELPPRRQRRLHLTVAEVIAGRRDGARETRAAEVAWHYLEAGAEAEALPWALAAGVAAEAAYAHDEAEQQFRTALDLARATGNREQEAAALEKLGEVLIVTSRHQEALPLEQMAMDLYRSAGDLLGEGRAVTRIAWVHAGTDTRGDAIDLVRDMIARLEPAGRSRVLLELYEQLVFDLMELRRPAEALQVLETMTELASGAEYQGFRASIETIRGYALIDLGRLDEGYDAILQALPRVEAAGNLYSVANSAGTLAFRYMQRGDLARARQYAEMSLNTHRRRNEPVAIANAVAGLAWIAFLQGNWGRVLADLSAAVETIWNRTDQPLIAYPLGHLGMMRMLMGADDSVALLKRAIEVAATRPSMAVIAHLSMAEYDLLAGRAEAARQRLDNLLSVLDERMFGPAIVRGMLARAYLDLGATDRATTLLAEARDLAERFQDRLSRVMIAPVEVELLGRQDRWREALDRSDEYLQTARAIGLPYMEAHILWSRGSIRDQQDKDAARRSLADALAIFHRLGCRLYADRTAEALRALGEVTAGATRFEHHAEPDEGV